MNISEKCVQIKEWLCKEEKKMKNKQDGFPKINDLFKIDETNNQQDDDDNTSIKYDFLSRYFAPWVGIPEDPVTGSAHTVLTPYWSTKFNGQKNFVARQCSKRGGDLSLTLNDNDNKVYVSGHACVVMSGKLNIV